MKRTESGDRSEAILAEIDAIVAYKLRYAATHPPAPADALESIQGDQNMRTTKASKPPIRVKIEPRYVGGRFPGWGLYLALVDKPYGPFDEGFRGLDGTFLGFNDMDYARENVRIINEGRLWLGLFRPLELVEDAK